MMKSTFAVIFDNDGVLCDTEGISSEAFELCLNQFGYVLEPGGVKKYSGLTAETAFDMLRNDFGSTPDFTSFWTKKNEIYANIVKEKPIAPINGAENLLCDLINNNIAIAVASSAKRTKVEFNLKEAGLFQYFQTERLVSSSEVSAGKPSPDLFLRAAEVLEISSSNCIAIEDSVNGLKAIRNAGMLPIALTTTFPREDLLSYTSEIYSDLSLLTYDSMRMIYDNANQYGNL